MGWTFLAGVGLVAVLYVVMDRLIRVGLWTRLFGRLGSSAPVVAWSLSWGVALAPFAWNAVPQGGLLRTLGTALIVMLAWRATTEDIDVAFGDDKRGYRVALIVCAVLSWFSPVAFGVGVYLLSHPFAVWQHHSTLPMRMLLMCAAYIVSWRMTDALGWDAAIDTAPLWFLLVTMQVSHYWITAIAKMWLGPRWYSWIVDNRMHHLAAGSYAWGWARFISWERWKYVVASVRVFRLPMQAFAFAVEFLAPFALLDPWAAVGLSLLWAGFHLGVVAVSGLFFWEWILTDLAIAWCLWQMPAQVSSRVFGWETLLLGIAFMGAFPFRHKLWKPIPLGWWDTPFTQRMHWIAVGKSGAEYGVYNDFMCPNERLYGKVHACFMAPVPGLSYHLGEVWKRELRDALRDAGPDLGALDAVRARFGVRVRSPETAQNHVAYLKRFFARLNEGARKSVLPAGLRWLKAPGDQLFYWGNLPAYRRQEDVAEIRLVYREVYFDEARLVSVQEHEVARFAIEPDSAYLPCAPEPDPKEIDEMLLAQADGKIIDLPKFSGGFVRSDDGRRRRWA